MILPHGHKDSAQSPVSPDCGQIPLSRRSIIAGAVGGLILGPTSALAQSNFSRKTPDTFSSSELVASGHRFFGGVSRSIATVIEQAVSRWGHPNGYILGQDAGAAIFAGARYGEGNMFTKNWGDAKVFWQGPSLGFDIGGDGNRTMMLAYRLQQPSSIFRRFVGVDGSAYIVGGVGMTLLVSDSQYLVPIRTGLGARLGLNIGYLKFTDRPTWNPF